MKRLHLHVQVADLAASRAFYERLFDSAPARVEADYAKWMLDEPPLNFAISTRGGKPGVDHVGIQVDSDEELAALKARGLAAALKARGLAAASTVDDDGRTDCCYARSDKHWVVDPQGLAWEHFHTLQDIPVFGAAPAQPDGTVKACCAPTAAKTGAQDSARCC